MSVIIPNTVMTLMLGVGLYLSVIFVKQMYHYKDYSAMVGYLILLTVLTAASFYLLTTIWVEGIRLLELRGGL